MTRTTKNRRKIRKLIVHCTATPEGEDYTVETIRRWHRDRGWRDIGYHWVVYRNGEVHSGRDEASVGAHTTGHNADSIGICYVGGCEPRNGKRKLKAKDTRTPAQKAALSTLLKELKKRYPEAKIYGHRDFAAKACPSFDARTEYVSIAP